jgi:hypothetical protein
MYKLIAFLLAILQNNKKNGRYMYSNRVPTGKNLQKLQKHRAKVTGVW